MSEERQSLLSSPSPSFASSSQSPYSYAGDRLAVDGISHPAWKTRMSFILVLITETMERMAFYGLMCNMIMFLNSNPLDWTLYNATFILLLVNGLSYVTAVIGGWLADACLGKFRTVVLFFVVYILGFAFWPLLYPYPYLRSHDKVTDPLWCAGANRSINDTANISLNQENCWWQVLLSVVAIAIGYGAVRVNIIPFGAFQVSLY
jgi:solute carrier family 15 (peptide/histidine transporter), member 3/4